MKQQNKLIKVAVSSLLGASLLLPAAWGLGLGDIESKAQLNQPLTARIKLLSSKEFTQEDLSARIASYEAYGKFGVSREPIHGQLKFEIQTNNDGSKFIQVSSSQAIKEPFLNFLVELNWPQGRLLREYTVLLDPPSLSSSQEVVQVAQPRPSETVSRPQPSTVRTEEPVTQAVTRPQANDSARRETQVSQSSQPRVQFTGDEWRVGRGETLWSIATRVRPECASMSQTLAALYRNNPSAFINNDIDRLKAGANLQVPAASQVKSISESIRYRDLKAEQGTQAPLDVRKTVTETASVEDNSTSGRLTISSVTDSDSLDTSGVNVKEGAEGEVSQGSQDDLMKTVESLRLENEQLKRELEAVKVQDSSGVALEDETLSVIAGSAQAKDDADEALQALAVEAEQAIENASSSTQNAQENTAPEQAAPVGNKPEVAAESNSQVEQSFWQKDGFWKWPLIILAALLSLLGLVFFLKKRQNELEKDLFVEETNNVDGFERQQPSFTAQSMAAPEVETDPLDEADILIARGKLEQAERLLVDSLKQDGANYHARIKLMEIYSCNGQVDNLKAQYQQLDDSFDHDSELGLKVASLMQSHTAANLAPEADVQISEELFLSEEEVFGDQDIDLSNEMDEILDQAVEQVDDSVDELFETISEEQASVTSKTEENVIEFTNDNLDTLNESLNDDEDSAVEQLSDDEAHTKIELAKAYIAMGDDESAQEILKEVEKEGSEEQMQIAKELLADL